MNHVICLAIMLLHCCPASECQCFPLGPRSPQRVGATSSGEGVQEIKGFVVVDSDVAVHVEDSETAAPHDELPADPQRDSRRPSLWPNRQIPFLFHACEQKGIRLACVCVVTDIPCVSCMINAAADCQRSAERRSPSSSRRWITGKRRRVSRSEAKRRVTSIGSSFDQIRQDATRSSVETRRAGDRVSQFPFLTVASRYACLFSSHLASRLQILIPFASRFAIVDLISLPSSFALRDFSLSHSLLLPSLLSLSSS